MPTGVMLKSSTWADRHDGLVAAVQVAADRVLQVQDLRGALVGLFAPFLIHGGLGSAVEQLVHFGVGVEAVVVAVLAVFFR